MISKIQILSMPIINSMKFSTPFRPQTSNTVIKPMRFVKLTSLFLLLNPAEYYYISDNCLVSSTILQ